MKQKIIVGQFDKEDGSGFWVWIPDGSKYGSYVQADGSLLPGAYSFPSRTHAECALRRFKMKNQSS